MDAEKIEEYLEYYDNTQGLLPEKLMQYRTKFEEKGFLEKKDFYELAYESSTRSAYHVKKNPGERCRNVSSNIVKVDDEFSKIAMITSMEGFKAPTASVLLTVINPEKHAVVDTRVWASLERLGYLDGRKETFDADDYVKMIRPIRRIAEKTGYSTEEVGYALFAYDVDKREGNLH